MQNIIRVAFVPFFPVLGNLQDNLQKISEIVDRCQEKENGAEVIFFPELSTTGYLLENLTFSTALSIPGDLPEKLLRQSEKSEIHLGLSLKENAMIYNAHVALSGGEVKHIHKKIYLPTYGFFDEGRYFTPGSGLSLFEGRLGKTGTLICEDAFHPALVYALYESGVKHLFVGSCSPARGINEPGASTSSYLAWKKRLEVYAESFGIFCYYQNRSGGEDGVYFDGKSMFVSPNMTSIEVDHGDIFFHDVNLQDLEAAYQRGGPFHDENFDLNRRLFLNSGEIRTRHG